jgi:hypothetical protein
MRRQYRGLLPRNLTTYVRRYIRGGRYDSRKNYELKQRLLSGRLDLDLIERYQRAIIKRRGKKP